MVLCLGVECKDPRPRPPTRGSRAGGRLRPRTIGPWTSPAHLAAIAEQGYTIVPDAIEPDLVDALVEDLARLEHDLGAVPAANSFEGEHTVRIYNLLARSPALRSRSRCTRGAARSSRACSTAGCLISSLSSIAIDPGETAQPIHADDQLIPLPKPHPPVVCNSMWALTDFTEANGATRLVPGQPPGRRAHPTTASPTTRSPAEMARGSVLIWHGSLWHGGGANTTDERRIGIAMNYCAGYIRQQENQQLGIPAELAATFEPRLLELVGYGIYNGLIGHIDKQLAVRAARRLAADAHGVGCDLRR